MDVLDQELRLAEKSLVKLEEQQHEQQLALDGSSAIDETDDLRGGASSLTVFERLLELQTTADSLEVAQDYLKFLELVPHIPSGDVISSSSNDDLETLLSQAQICDELAHQVVLKHAESILDLCPMIYEEAYLPLFGYLRDYFVTLLREELQSTRYPSAKGCAELLGDENSTAYLANICQRLSQLESTHEQVVQAVEGVDAAKNENSALLELFHPLLDRVYFHFINTNNGDGDDPNSGSYKPKVTATRLDRLPEWLLNYVKNNFLQDDGPYQVIRSAMGPSSALPFCRELIRLVQWVLVDQRSFFDDPAISGPQSNPQFLYQAVEQFLEFDSILMELLTETTSANESMVMQSTTNNLFPTSEFTGLMDALIASNKELFDWWIQRERESVSSTLFPDDDNTDSSVPKTPLANYISPRAELFCSLIRSVQLKASTLTSPRRYLREVAVPLCSQFVDALHETSVTLRNSLMQKDNRRQQPQQQQQASPRYGSMVDSEKQRIVSNINEWIEIINGTQLASDILLSSDRAVSSQSDHDLGRFGRSLERLVEVMMDEFAAAFVETTLMEHAKFANYLMLASHFLASPQHVDEDMMDKLTPELGDTNTILHYFQESCDTIIHPGEDGDEEDKLAACAPLGMRVRVADRLVEKLLDVALDTNNVTPDIWLEGATVFSRDVNVILGAYRDIPAVDQLLEVTQFMILDYDSFCGIFAAIGGLIGSDVHLDIEELNADAKLVDEAISMLKAKNVNCSLGYAVSILNRRRG